MINSAFSLHLTYTSFCLAPIVNFVFDFALRASQTVRDLERLVCNGDGRHYYQRFQRQSAWWMLALLRYQSSPKARSICQRQLRYSLGHIENSRRCAREFSAPEEELFCDYS